MRNTLQAVLFTLGLASLAHLGVAQEKAFEFEAIYDVPVTSVKSQGRTGTCWCFSTVSFIEAECLRKGGESLDLSEMYIVRHVYPEKARRYFLFHGKNNFSEGGQAHDVMNAIRKCGLVPEEFYSGRPRGEEVLNHQEMVSTMTSVVKNYVETSKSKPSKSWYETIDAILDIYMGAPVVSFSWKEKTVTPKEFMSQQVKINPDDYVELSSYTHHPDYVSFDLEVPDNWSHDLYYNLPLNELMEVMNNALGKGYSFVWDGDVSESHFQHRKGGALVPSDEKAELAPTEEKAVDASLRQDAFENWSATDDHLMHITGLSKDQKGTTYYKTKNSWGAKSNSYGGFLYMSESYMRLNTVAILIHKDAIPKHLRKKLGL